MGFADDFILLPNWIKYLAFMALLLGTTFKLPFIGFSIGDFINPFFDAILGAFGINLSYKEIVIIIFLAFGVLLILSVQKAVK